MENIEMLRYPVGRFTPLEKYSAEDIQNNMLVIANFPEALKSVANNMITAQLDTPYRPEGWTARQVIHHVADSHMNAYVRFKLALTEKIPTIKPYNEKAWSALPDANSDIQVSLDLLVALHKRWLRVMKNMKHDEWNLLFYHPEASRTLSLDWVLHLYAWHCNHHLAHVKICAAV